MKQVSSTSTVFVNDEYTVDNVRSRVAAKMRGLPRVDGQGVPIVGPDISTVQVVSSPAAATDAFGPMASTLSAVAAKLGVNLPALLDSASFTERLAAIEPGDNQALATAVTDAIVANPSLLAAPSRPVMQPNRAQGTSANAIPPTRPATPQERIASQLKKLPAVDGQGIPVI